MSKTYSVKVTKTQWVYMDIEADNEDEAVEKALSDAEVDDSIFWDAAEELEAEVDD